jgi:hypothetical protein
MKKNLLLILLIFTTCITQAQSFGIKAGLNFSDFSGDDTEDLKGITSFHVGVLKEFIITKNVSFQPELLFSTQGVKVEKMDDDYKLNYFTLPLMVKFYINDAFSVHAGPQLSLLAGETKDVLPIEGKTFEYGLAGGLEYTISGGLFIQGRYCMGLSEISKDADVKNSVIQLSLGYFF